MDGDLKLACEAVIQLYARAATQPIQAFMTTLDAPHLDSATYKDNSTSGGERKDGKVPLPSRSAALSVERDFRAALEKEVPEMKRRLGLFLSSPPDSAAASALQVQQSMVEAGSGTVAVLLGHIQERTVDAYVAFRKAVEFLPAEENSTQQDQNFMAPDAIRAMFRDLH